MRCDTPMTFEEAKTMFEIVDRQPIPQTNEEYIKSLNTEQLADALMKIFMTRTFCHLCHEGDVCDIGYKCKYSGGKKIEDWLVWLKQPHAEKE